MFDTKVDVGAILEGHTKELFGLDKDMSKARLQICASCPLYKPSIYGPICNSHLWYNPITGDVCTEKRDGYVNGCGCRLNAKTRVATAMCPLSKW